MSIIWGGRSDLRRRGVIEGNYVNLDDGNEEGVNVNVEEGNEKEVNVTIDEEGVSVGVELHVVLDDVEMGINGILGDQVEEVVENNFMFNEVKEYDDVVTKTYLTANDITSYLKAWYTMEETRNLLELELKDITAPVEHQPETMLLWNR